MLILSGGGMRGSPGAFPAPRGWHTVASQNVALLRQVCGGSLLSCWQVQICSLFDQWHAHAADVGRMQHFSLAYLLNQHSMRGRTPLDAAH